MIRFGPLVTMFRQPGRCRISRILLLPQWLSPNVFRLLCFTKNSGDRYEAYLGWPIVTGNPGDSPAVFNSSGSGNSLTTCNAPYPPYCGNPYGNNYKIQDHVWTGSIGGSPNLANPVFDVVAPQAINYFMNGDLANAMKYAKAMISQWNGYSVDSASGGTTWDLGQVMFVMRVLSLDNELCKDNDTGSVASTTELFPNFPADGI